MTRPTDADSEAIQVTQIELSRLREIEHLAWHLLDDSEENATTGEITITPMREDYDTLSALLPDEHPEPRPRHVAPVSEKPAIPEGWKLVCEKCGADNKSPCGWPDNCTAISLAHTGRK